MNECCDIDQLIVNANVYILDISSKNLEACCYINI